MNKHKNSLKFDLKFNVNMDKAYIVITKVPYDVIQKKKKVVKKEFGKVI